MADFLKRTNEYSVKHKRRKRWYKIVSILASIVVFCTVYALILPAITMEKDPICGFEEHSHDQACYEKKLICGYTDECQNKTEEPDSDNITSESFIDKEDETAKSDVSSEVESLDNDISGSEIKDDSPVESSLGESDKTKHIHTDECYELVLTCRKVEHEHEKSCYLKKNAEEGNFTINGKSVDDEYTWSDENELLLFEVKMHGNASFDGNLPKNIAPELEVEVYNGEEESEDTDIYNLLSFRLNMTADDKKINLSECIADVSVTVNNEIISSAVPMYTDDNSNETGKSGELVMVVFNDSQEAVAEADIVEDQNPVLKFSVRADGEANIEIQPNPSFTIQHFLKDFPLVSTLTQSELAGYTGNVLPFINASNGAPNPEKTENKGSIEGNLELNNGTGKEGSPSTQPVFYVKLKGDPKTEAGAEMDTSPVFRRLFIDEYTSYRINPQIEYMNRLYKGRNEGEYNPNYTLSELWIYKPKEGAVIADGAEFDEANYNTPYKILVPLDDDGVRHHPEIIRFTNNPSNTHISKEFEDDGVTLKPTPETDIYPYRYTVLIEKNTVVRLVFETTFNPQHERDVNFFDYDITDGNIYTSQENAVGQVDPQKTSLQGTDGIWYANTDNKGINSKVNYDEKKLESDKAAKYAFGNANTGTGLKNEAWGPNTLNIANKPVGDFKGSFGYCTFGLINSLTYGTIQGLPIPNWSDNVVAPDLFSAADSTTDGDGKVLGKTAYLKIKDSDGNDTETSRYSLGFERCGGTYTLSYVYDNLKKNKAEENLTKFINPRKINGTPYTSIFTNEFWPMDASDSFGGDGHDLKFGSADANLKDKRKFSGANGETGSFPVSDNGAYDHNAYFGMSFTVDFTVEPGYCSPLAYWFYGDDDMWVFLSEVNEYTDENGNTSERVENSKLVADIGGVHSSVGEYVNLWEYIDEVGFDDPAQKYRLTIFYTERGASGSTCYMRMTVPLNAHNVPPPDRNDELVFEKVLLDEEGNTVISNDNAEEFAFRLKLSIDGIAYEDAYEATVYNRTNTEDHNPGNFDHERPIGISDPTSGIYEFTLKGGQYLVVSGLPPGTEYTIEEVDGGNKYATVYQQGRHQHMGFTDTEEESKEIIEEELGDVKRYSIKVSGRSSESDGSVVNNYVRFTNSPAIKREVSPGDKEGVQVGDEIIYEILWGNDAGETANVSVTDQLDAGLDFIGAKFGSGENTTESDWKISEPDDNGKSFSYDPETRIVTWKLPRREAEEEGIVALKVRVNREALKDDEKVVNTADVYIGLKHLITNEVENPVWEPEKTETDPGQGKALLIGNEVTYRITWKNYLSSASDIKIRDPLDVNVSYKLDSAAVYLNDSTVLDTAKFSTAEEQDENGAYRTVLYWELDNISPGTEGYVEFKVTVKESAVHVGEIWNWGYVKIGNKPEIETNHIDNPIYGYELPATGGIGNTVFVITGLTFVFGSMITGLVLRCRLKSKKRICRP